MRMVLGSECEVEVGVGESVLVGGSREERWIVMYTRTCYARQTAQGDALLERRANSSLTVFQAFHNERYS
jgi:hypothetical protein